MPGIVELCVYWYRNFFARLALLSETAHALPPMSSVVNLRIRWHYNGKTSIALLLVPSRALPSVTGIVEFCILRNYDSQARSATLRESSLAYPTMTGVVQFSIRWNDDGLAIVTRSDVTPNAFPTSSGVIRLGILRHVLCGGCYALKCEIDSQAEFPHRLSSQICLTFALTSWPSAMVEYMKAAPASPVQRVVGRQPHDSIHSKYAVAWLQNL